MSALISLTQDVSAQVIQAHPMAVQAAGGDGILDWLTNKNSQTQTLVRAMVVTLAIVFVVWQAVVSRMAMARVIIAGVTAGMFVWIVWNVTDLKDRVGNEVNSMPAVVQITDHPDHPGLVSS